MERDGGALAAVPFYYGTTPMSITESFEQLGADYNRVVELHGLGPIRSFGTFGCIVRMTDDFEILKHWASQKRRRAVNAEVRAALRRIVLMGTLAQMVEKGELVS